MNNRFVYVLAFETSKDKVSAPVQVGDVIYFKPFGSAEDQKKVFKLLHTYAGDVKKHYPDAKLSILNVLNLPDINDKNVLNVLNYMISANADAVDICETTDEYLINHANGERTPSSEYFNDEFCKLFDKPTNYYEGEHGNDYF